MLYFMHYNFGRIHKSLRVAPAMEAGVSDHVWSLEEIAGLTDCSGAASPATPARVLRMSRRHMWP